VTVIEQLDLSSSEREAWLTKLKSALGCGGSIEADGALVLQGDHRERVAAWLKERGVKRVSVG
jgi:translation initiation factor 1